MAEPAPAAVSESRSQPSPGLARVLVVEDDARMRRVLELLLSEHWTVEAVADARAAMRAARERPPDLVLTDLLLPGMDGFDFLRQLRAEAGTRTLPIIVISGLTDEADRLKALEAGANDYLIKPFSERELLLRVTTHLEMSFLRREAALRESEAQVRSILDGALDAVVGMDAGGVVTYWNSQAEATFGWARDEAMGQRLSDMIIPPELREAHEQGRERFFETGEGPMLNRRVEVEAQRKDGSRIPVELAITVIKGWGFYRFSAFCRDISLRRAADAERNRLLEEAREANRMKDEFLAMLSHELRTPLSAIVGWAHMLRTGGLDEATVTRAIETIDRNAKVQNQLIEDILDVSRIVAGKFHLDMRNVDLVRVLEGAIDTVSPTAAAKGVEVRTELDPVVRPCCPAIGDPDRLQQVVWNLLTNAIKFTPRGGTVTVALRRVDDPPEFEVVVRDTGIGITRDFLPHISRSCGTSWRCTAARRRRRARARARARSSPCACPSSRRRRRDSACPPSRARTPASTSRRAWTGCGCSSSRTSPTPATSWPPCSRSAGRACSWPPRGRRPSTCSSASGRTCCSATSRCRTWTATS